MNEALAAAPMLSIRGLTHDYAGGVRALDDVTLEIPAGMFGLLGPNGAGKSTLMRCLATLQTPSAGTMQFDGIDILRQGDALRATLGYLPQDFGVYPRVSALELLEHLAVLKGMSARGPRRAQVQARLQQVNLWAERHQAVAGFSGGMRQRFGIAQALLGEPRLIIVDEPTAGLDPEERQRFNNLLAEIGRNVVVILSTHIVDDVSALCQRMAILAGGRIVEQGVPGELIEDLQGRVWQHGVERADLERARQTWPVIATRLQAGHTVIRVLADTRPTAAFEPVPVTLEDVYFATLHQARQRVAGR